MKTLLSYGTSKAFSTGFLPMASLRPRQLQVHAHNDNR